MTTFDETMDQRVTLGVKKLHRMHKDQVSYALEIDNEYRKGWGMRTL